MNRFPCQLVLGVLSLLLCLTAQGYGATILVTVPSPGQIHLEGSDFANVAAADLTLSFDPSTFTAPQVQSGSLIQGALLASNPTGSGQVRLAFVSSHPIQGSGTVATVRGQAAGTAGLRIFGLSGTLRDPQGKALPLRVVIPSASVDVTPPKSPDLPVVEDFPSTSSPVLSPAPALTAPDFQPDSSGLVQSGPSSSRSRGYISGDTAPAPRPEKESRDVSDAADGPREHPTETSRRPAEPELKPETTAAPPPEAALQSIPSVLSRFEGYEGPRIPSRLAALFDEALAPEISQSPRIALSDGRTPLVVRITAMPGAEKPSLALINGRVVSSAKVSEGHWEIEVLAEKGSAATTLFAMGNGKSLEIPLVVAPPIAIEKEICVSLRGIEEKAERLLPNKDFNGDGQWSALDDYILTANCLAVESSKAKRVIVGK